jgi:phenylalanine-4-hydroxylase
VTNPLEGRGNSRASSGRRIAQSAGLAGPRLRGNYSHIRPDYTVDQPYSAYSDEEHERWRRLYSRQMALMPRYAADEFIENVEQLSVADGIPDFARINEFLASATGFEIVAVPGLVPDDVFYDHLANRRFPVSWWIRKESELDYLVEPDVFHDFFGHVPLLAHPVFADYMVEYGKAGPLAVRMGTVPLLARLYWYTIEFGLIRTDDGLRAFGAGILSSKGETVFAVDSPTPNRIGFELERVLMTEYRIDDFQKTYFVIDGFDQMFDETRKPFAPIYEKLKGGEPYPADTVLATDRVIHRGGTH